MVWYAVIGTLAAFGLASVLWALYGWFLPVECGTVMIYTGRSGAAEEIAVRRYRWLRDLGLVRGPMLLVRQEWKPEEREMLLHYPEIEFCSPEELSSRLELERKRLG